MDLELLSGGEHSGDVNWHLFNCKTQRVHVAASAPVSERSVKLRKPTHRFHKAGVYCANFYSDPVVGRVGANALVGSEFNSNKA